MRNVISRLTMGLVALALTYAAYKTGQVTLDIFNDPVVRMTETTGGRSRDRRMLAIFPAALCLLFVLGGLFFSATAVLPSAFFERFATPPREDDGRYDEPSWLGWWSTFWR